ncbi:MAG: MFS transporter, partial [Pontibacterium sp.]
MASNNKDSIEQLYDWINGDEDSRVCKDISEKACHDQPQNFFAYLVSNIANKIADEFASAKLILPWLFGVLGVPATFVGFLIPIREAGVLVPQLVIAAAIRKVAVRKYVWIFGGLLSAFSLLGMAYATINFTGREAGIALICMLIVFSLARGICSVAAKDVLGKTI